MTSSANLLDRQVEVTGELSVVLPSGRTTRLEASGNSIRWFVGSVRDVARSASLTRTQRARLADTLDHMGATFSMINEEDVILTAGVGRRSLLGWLLLGSSRFKLHRPLAWFRATD